MEQKIIETSADQAFAHGTCSKKRTINIQPITRIEGHARIVIQLDDDGNVADTRLNIMALRGFEKFIEGRPAEEVPRIVNRICGICPWMHHTASNKAVDGCFQAKVPPTAEKLRELMQVMAQINDKILHFFFLAAPDFVLGPGADYSVRNVLGIVQARAGARHPGGEDAPGRADDDREVRRQGHPSRGGGARRLCQIHD